NSRDRAPEAGSVQEAAEETDKLDYATVVSVTPVTEKTELYATVLGAEPVHETTTSTTPREVCQDVVVQERLPERDGNVGGAVAGGVIGNRIDRNHVGGKVVERVERQCHTVQDSSQSSRTVAWNVTYRNPDGTTGTMRTADKPGERIALGTEDRTVAYDVTYRYDGAERTVRLAEDPGDRLPVLDGQVLAKVATSGNPDTTLQ